MNCLQRGLFACLKRNQIPRFFKHGLTLADVTDDQSLQAALSEKMIKQACKLFNVHLFDGHPERYQNFLNKLLGKLGENWGHSVKFEL